MRQIDTKFHTQPCLCSEKVFIQNKFSFNFSVKLMSFLCGYNFMNHRNKDYEEMELIYTGKMFVGSDYFMNIL